ncbi:neuronal-specific septin-3 isoform X2 [Taeniopygia guttata]|uniref:neuronal-specific septin-3 isoform X2 n=1 Tax=Taeniopygia guttata TaxID=59729 RepID=UPI003BB9A17F
MAMEVFGSIIPWLAQATPLPACPLSPGCVAHGHGLSRSLAAWAIASCRSSPAGAKRRLAHTGEAAAWGTQAPWGTAAVGRLARPPALLPPHRAGLGTAAAGEGGGHGAGWSPLPVGASGHRAHGRTLLPPFSATQPLTGVMRDKVRGGGVLCHARGPHPCWPGWEAEQCHVPGGHSRVGTAGLAQPSPPTSPSHTGRRGLAVWGGGCGGRVLPCWSCVGAAASAEPGSSLEPEERSMEPPAVPEEEEEEEKEGAVPLSMAPGPVGCQLFGYVGIEAVLDQMKIKTMKTGFEFNIMVVGQSGLGKSTMVNTLFKSKVSRKSSQPGQEERIPKTVQLQSITHVIEEKGVKMKLTVTDTPGFGDQINNENCWEPIIKYINEQYERYLREEILITRKRKIPDTRVHGCVYFVPPTGHWLRPLDLEFMRRLSRIVNVVPVIAKADTLTLEERAEFKQRIQEDLKTHTISVYPQEDFDQDPEDRALNDRIREKIPFAVVGADQEHQVNGKRVLGRKTKWGIIEVENPAHCEFPLLRDLLIRSHLQDLKDITHNVHYESYRVRRLNESNRPGLSPLNGLPGKGEASSHL